MTPMQIDFGNDSPARREPVVGIDLGTTNSLIAYMDLTEPKVIPAPGGEKLIPSVISIGDTGDIVVGAVALERLIAHPERTIYSAKRFMGKGLADVENELSLLPFAIDRRSTSVVKMRIGGREFTPPDVGAMVLNQLRANAEEYLGVPVKKAVITVPAYFNDAQRQATKDAGRIAGLEVLRLVNEPTAAALAYGLDKRKQGTIAVYDFGGGTFDISILRLDDGVFEVLATNGDTKLGGDDIDNLLLEIALDDVNSEWTTDLSRDHEAVQLLRRAVIDAKEKLSFSPFVDIVFDYQDRAYRRQLDREGFERLVAPIVDRTLEPCRQCMADAKVTPEQIDEVVMVGGSTRIPLVRRAVESLFRSRPHTELNPDEVVALGAAVQAGVLSGDVTGTLLLDVTPLSLGIETMGGVVTKLIHRNSTIPASATESFTTSIDGQRNVLIHVVQGEREMVKDCRSLARFDLKGIEPMPAGMARIEVKFLTDANGILSVTARDARSGKETTVDVKPTYGLTDAEVEQRILDSIENAEADFQARQAAEARVEADTILAAVEKAKESDAWFDLTSEERDSINATMNELLVVYHHDDHHLIRSKIDELNTKTMKLAETMMNTAVRGALKGTKIE